MTINSNIKFSQMPAAATIGDEDIFPLVQSGANKQANAIVMRDYLRGDSGYAGSQGETGQGFIIAKTYNSVANLLADTSPTGIIAGEFAVIDTGDVEDPDDSKLYLWNGANYQYITDLSGAMGITGQTGATGPIGYSGSRGYTGSQGITGFSGDRKSVV